MSLIFCKDICRNISLFLLLLPVSLVTKAGDTDSSDAEWGGTVSADYGAVYDNTLDQYIIREKLSFDLNYQTKKSFYDLLR